MRRGPDSNSPALPRRRWRLPLFGTGVALAALLLPCDLPEAPGQTTLASADRSQPPSEYQVKAAFLLNFAQFVEWPASAFATTDSPIVVGVLGEDPFGATLEQTFADQTPQGRRLVVRRARQVEDLLDCHLVFVCRSERDRVAQILASLGGRSCLSVGEVENFALRGGVINFYLDESRVRFELNVEAAERGGLTVRSPLLKRAKIVGRAPTRGGSDG